MTGLDSELIETRAYQMGAFLRIARGHRGASSGERAAYQLAKQVEKISDLMMSLDADKQEGFLNLLRAAAWPDTRDAVLEKMP